MRTTHREPQQEARLADAGVATARERRRGVRGRGCQRRSGTNDRRARVDARTASARGRARSGGTLGDLEEVITARWRGEGRGRSRQRRARGRARRTVVATRPRGASFAPARGGDLAPRAGHSLFGVHRLRGGAATCPPATSRGNVATPSRNLARRREQGSCSRSSVYEREASQSAQFWKNALWQPTEFQNVKKTTPAPKCSEV